MKEQPPPTVRQKVSLPATLACYAPWPWELSDFNDTEKLLLGPHFIRKLMNKDFAMVNTLYLSLLGVDGIPIRGQYQTYISPFYHPLKSGMHFRDLVCLATSQIWSRASDEKAFASFV